MSGKRAKQLRKWANILATHPPGYYWDAQGQQRHRPGSPWEVYKRLKAGRMTDAEYERLGVALMEEVGA